MPSVSAIVTAFDRIGKTVKTLEVLHACTPPPGEILVHVDGNQIETVVALQKAFPDIGFLVSDVRVGPGGARNKLIRAARHDLVASFDDDSYPLDFDYFQRIQDVFKSLPDAAVIHARVSHRDDAVPLLMDEHHQTSDFCGCACIYRRQDFLATDGYLPLIFAYSMEEVDVAIQLAGLDKKIFQHGGLRVYHDTDFALHPSPGITAAKVSNPALLVWLRYPLIYWPWGTIQYINSILWLVRHGRFRGILKGLFDTVASVIRYASHRKPVSPGALHRYFSIRRQPVVWTSAAQVAGDQGGPEPAGHRTTLSS